MEENLKSSNEPICIPTKVINKDIMESFFLQFYTFLFSKLEGRGSRPIHQCFDRFFFVRKLGSTAFHNFNFSYDVSHKRSQKEPFVIIQIKLLVFWGHEIWSLETKNNEFRRKKSFVLEF